MHFGKKLIQLRHDEWAPYYLDYSSLKELLERSDNGNDNDDETCSTAITVTTTPTSKSLQEQLTREFLQQLDTQVKKCVLFYLQQQGEIAHGLQAAAATVRSTHEVLLLVTTKTPSEQRLTALNDVQQELHQIAARLLRTVQFVDLNLTGIRKILKKHDRVTRSDLTQVYLGRRNTTLAPLLAQHDSAIATLTATLEEVWHDEQEIIRRHAPALQRKASSLSGDTAATNNPDPVAVLLGEIATARRRLQQNSEFALLLAAPMMVSLDADANRSDNNSSYPPAVNSRFSNLLNLMSTFLYMSNYYIVAPTSGSYAQKLGGSVAWSGLIIGMTPVAALVSTVLYSWWTSHSYKSALVFASTCSMVGNLLYAMGLPCNNLSYVLIGRFLNGFGSARSINRRYIADTFSKEDRTVASAAFVTAGALGMAAGPAVASALHVTVLGPLNEYWQAENSPGWFMAVSWAIYLICLLAYFQDPPRLQRRQRLNARASDLEASGNITGEQQPLLASQPTITTTPTNKLQVDQTAFAVAHGNTSNHQSKALWRNVPVMTTFCIYFLLKMVIETCLSSCSNLTRRYFGWSTGFVGVYLALLGLLLLPANLVVSRLAVQFSDRQLIAGLLVTMVVGCVAVLQYTAEYTVVQYVIGSIVLFVSATALEGPNMSLLSKTIPKSSSRGIFNVGLLATESGTLGRSVADVCLTLWGSQGLEHLLNGAFGSLAVIGVFVIGLTYAVFDYLEPIDEDNDDEDDEE